MKILVDEMPVFPDYCWFSDQYWDHEEHIWKPCCTLGQDGVTDCDLENGECSKLHSFQLKFATTEPIQYKIPNTFPIPDACRNCSNHPSNGGTGICNCTLGLPKVTSGVIFTEDDRKLPSSYSTAASTDCPWGGEYDQDNTE